MIENFKRYKPGERVRGIVTYDGEAMVEGDILYVHPTNGWLTIRVEKVYLRTKHVNSTVHFEFAAKELATPYNHGMWANEVFRVSEELPKDKQRAWKGAMKLASAARTDGRDRIPA